MTTNEQYEDEDYNDCIRFLQVFKYIPHKFRYLIKDFIQINSSLDLRTKMEIYLLNNLNELYDIRSFCRNLTIQYETIGSDFYGEGDDFMDVFNNNGDLRLYVIIYKNAIKPIINNIFRLLKTMRSLTILNEGGLSILTQNILGNFIETFGTDEHYSTINPNTSSIITPFINDQINRNITFNKNSSLVYSVIGEEEQTANFNDDGTIDTSTNYNEIENIIDDDIIGNNRKIRLCLTRTESLFNRLTETNYIDEEDIYYLQRIEDTININIRSILHDEYNTDDDSDEEDNDEDLLVYLERIEQQRALIPDEQRLLTFLLQRQRREREQGDIELERIANEHGEEMDRRIIENPNLENEENPNRRRVVRRRPRPEPDNRRLLIDNTRTIFNECCCCFNEKELPLIIPCNHNVICYDCIMSLYNTYHTRKCPFCRIEY